VQPAKFRQARRHLGLSATRFAALIGVNERQVRRWEREEAPLSRMADLLLSMMMMSAEIRKFVGFTKRELGRAAGRPKFDFDSPVAPIARRKKRRIRK
jgi:DNA-binding transcriptional regulator YiaG